MKYYEGCEEITREKTRDFQAKMKMGYDFKKAYAARRAWEFYNHPEVAGRCYVAVGGLDSITLFLFLRSIGIDVPATSVSMLEDRSIQRVHKALGVKGLLPVINQKTNRPYNKVEVIREYGFPVLSKEIAGKIYTLQHPTEKNATVRHAIMTGETGAYGGYRKGTRMKMAQKWLEIFGGPENEREGTDYKTAPFQVSELCCYYLKEKPCDDYAKESGRFPYMGLMASEGGRRQKALMLNGCNYISKTTKRSAPLCHLHQTGPLDPGPGNGGMVSRTLGGVRRERRTPGNHSPGDLRGNRPGSAGHDPGGNREVQSRTRWRGAGRATADHKSAEDRLLHVRVWYSHREKAEPL